MTRFKVEKAKGKKVRILIGNSGNVKMVRAATNHCEENGAVYEL